MPNPVEKKYKCEGENYNAQSAKTQHTRFDKLASRFLAFVQLGCIRILLA